MSVKKYQFFCEKCNYKRFTDGSDIQDLVEVKTAPLPGGSPTLDLQIKKEVFPNLHQPGTFIGGTVLPKSTPQKKRFKCPNCGFIIMAKKLNETNFTDGRETGSAR